MRQIGELCKRGNVGLLKENINILSVYTLNIDSL
jgi:hypothetical protein